MHNKKEAESTWHRVYWAEDLQNRQPNSRYIMEALKDQQQATKREAICEGTAYKPIGRAP